VSNSATNFGETLQRARMARGLSIADAERALKIRPAYLSALEEERFDALPPRAYAKGFIRSYAGFLGIDPEPLLAIYEQVQPAPRESGAPPVVDIPIEPAVAPSPLRRFITYAIVVVGIAVVALLYGFYAKISEFARSSPPPSAAVTPSPNQGVGVPPEAPRGGPGVAPAPGPGQGGGLMLAVAVKERSWVRVEVDGEEVFSGVLDEGHAQTWQGKKRISIRVGNAGGVEVTFNGQPLGPLGRRGRVVDRTFSATGESEGNLPGEPAARTAPNEGPAQQEPAERP
jgi:cytoskeleton protein RodZ